MHFVLWRELLECVRVFLSTPEFFFLLSNRPLFQLYASLSCKPHTPNDFSFSRRARPHSNALRDLRLLRAGFLLLFCVHLFLTFSRLTASARNLIVTSLAPLANTQLALVTPLGRRLPAIFFLTALFGQRAAPVSRYLSFISR